MAYTTQADIQTYIDPDKLRNMLSDDDSGSAVSGLLDSIINLVSADIDGRLANIYKVPFSPTPPIIRSAATILACETLFDRRLPVDVENPFRSRANGWRKRLEDIGAGKLNLDYNFPRAFYQGNAILEYAKCNQSTLGS